eukprot:scaffold1678_cov287-Alexandrium_tamarense.AAC.6
MRFAWRTFGRFRFGIRSRWSSVPLGTSVGGGESDECDLLMRIIGNFHVLRPFTCTDSLNANTSQDDTPKTQQQQQQRVDIDKSATRLLQTHRAIQLLQLRPTTGIAIHHAGTSAIPAVSRGVSLRSRLANQIIRASQQYDGGGTEC